jgi:hypothetical protein
MRLALLVRAIVALGLGLAAAPALADPAYYYCWAPDPATGKVWVSETRPVGPMAERGTYGAKYAAWLKATGKTATTIPAYCAMRDTMESIERARAALPQESCRECGGARDFTDASMGGRPTIPARRVTASPQPIAPRLPQIAPQSPEKRPLQTAEGPWIVVLGNVNLGRTVWSQGGADLRQRVDAMAHKIAPSGWITLVSAREKGAGAAMCVKDGQQVRFFSIFPRATSKDAIKAAQVEANAFAGKVHQTSFICGLWLANDYSGTPKPKSLYDYIKDGLYERLKGECDGNLPPIEVNNYGLRIGGAEEPTDGSRPCRVHRATAIGVRG